MSKKELELPEGLTEDERNDCLRIAKQFGSDTALQRAKLYMRWHNFLVGYTPINTMPNRKHVLQALPKFTSGVEFSKQSLKIELEYNIKINELVTLFNKLQPDRVYVSDNQTIIYLTWS